MITPTPRTDAMACEHHGKVGTFAVAMVDLARQLERELAAANESRAQIAPLKARIAELNAQLDRRDRAAMDAHADADCERERATGDDAARRDERILRGWQ